MVTMTAIGEGSALWGVDMGDGRAIIPVPGTFPTGSRAAADRLIAANPGAMPVLLELRKVEEHGDK